MSGIIGFGMVSPEVDEPRHPWYQKRNHVRLPKKAESKGYLDDKYAGGGSVVPPEPVAQSIFGNEIPAQLSSGETNAYTLGTVFTVDVQGIIYNVRVYRHPDFLSTLCPIAIYADNNPLSEYYDSESEFYGPGWNDIRLGSPLYVSPGVTYMAAYFNSEGDYAYTSHRFDNAVVSGNITALSDAAAGGNGKFKAASTPSIPETSFGATWYGIDVIFKAGW